MFCLVFLSYHPSPPISTPEKNLMYLSSQDFIWIDCSILINCWCILWYSAVLWASCRSSLFHFKISTLLNLSLSRRFDLALTPLHILHYLQCWDHFITTAVLKRKRVNNVSLCASLVSSSMERNRRFGYSAPHMLHTVSVYGGPSLYSERISMIVEFWGASSSVV